MVARLFCLDDPIISDSLAVETHDIVAVKLSVHFIFLCVCCFFTVLGQHFFPRFSTFGLEPVGETKQAVWRLGAQVNCYWHYSVCTHWSGSQPVFIVLLYSHVPIRQAQVLPHQHSVAFWRDVILFILFNYTGVWLSQYCFHRYILLSRPHLLTDDIFLSLFSLVARFQLHSVGKNTPQIFSFHFILFFTLLFCLLYSVLSLNWNTVLWVPPDNF